MTRRNLPPVPNAGAAYFFDIDGTLAEIAPTPAEATMHSAIAKRVAALYDATGGAVALVTGRSLPACDALFPERTLPVAAQHGLERRRADRFIVRVPADPGLLASLRKKVRNEFNTRSGVLIEDKGASIALHYRSIPRAAPAINARAKRIADELGSGISVQRGKRVVELMIAGADKGLAVRAFLAEPPFRGRQPVFIGDDISDEKAFQVVNQLGGVSIKVGAGRTQAQWRLRGVTDVAAWLDSRE